MYIIILQIMVQKMEQFPNDSPNSFSMIQGTSGRKYLGFVAQRVEEALIVAVYPIWSSLDWLKPPIYAEKLKDSEEDETNEYDTTSEIIGYSYHLRYEEFIPLFFL